MNSMPNSEQIGSDDAAVAAVEPVGQQIRRADSRFRRVDEEVSKFEFDSGHNPPNLQRPVLRSRLGRLTLQGLIGLLTAACIGAIGMILQSHGEGAKQLIARWEPQLSAPAATSPVSAQSSPSTAQAPAADATSPQTALPASLDQTRPTDIGPTAAGPSSGQEQLVPLLRGFLAVVEHDIEELKDSIEQLKSSQDQMARSNAAVAEQLKNSQEQMARLLAKDSDPQVRPKPSAPAARSIATSTAKPLPKLSSQTRSQPPAPQRGRPE
ncbi:hypothetical protein [Bradyrhizobium erythrophlei]|uniref:hypothetical protein n=1 Tax=Bradyrhizobium erythrophlei TaxID=1437360 RepID=UPI0012EC3739|nr:hypothetical protein [Bradyrhizobium erythrophlei]